MWFKPVYIKSAFFGALLMSPIWSYAASFPCDQSHVCEASALVKRINAPQSLEALPVAPNKTQKDSLAFYLENLQLTPMQYEALNKVQQSQFPFILQSVRNLEDAHLKLRDMAINNAYDQPAAEALTETIVNHTAKLALLNAQREYEIFAMLSPAQVERYQALVLHSN